MARGGVLKSNIMWRAGLSYEMLNEYVGLMTDAMLLDTVLMKNKVIFKPTDRGLKFLYHCHEIMDLLETEDDGHKPYRRIQLLPNSLSHHMSSNMCHEASIDSSRKLGHKAPL